MSNASRVARYQQTEKGQAALARGRATEKANGAAKARTERRIADGRNAITCAKYQLNQKVYAAEVWREAPEKRHPIEAKRVVVLSDIQIPFEDPAAVNQALAIIEIVKPDTVILNGDIVDCYAESDFLKDPKKSAESIPETHERTDQLMRALKGIPQKLWVGGNHEDRWRKLLWSEAPYCKRLLAMHEEASGRAITLLDSTKSFAKLFSMDKYGFTYYPYGHRLYLAEGNLAITHGKYASRHSGYSAKRTWEWLGKSCIVGHTHRMGSFLVTQDGREMGAWENGCLCQLEPEYDDAPNWQQGFSVIRITGPQFHVIPVPIVRRNNKPVAVWQGMDR